jgi:putative GTP pyrophosphokinase
MTKSKSKSKTLRKVDTSTNRAVTEYENLRPTINAYTEKLGTLLKDLIARHNIKPQSVEHRTKTIESFREKINRPGKKYSDPIKQLTDLSGHRIVVYYLADIEKISKIIQDEFCIDTAASLDKRDDLAPNEFGYLSRHHIISLKAPRTSLPEWSEWSNIKAEIQLRTVLQHAWAAIEHSMQYKTEVDIPSSSRRRLFRLSGLLELADEEFNALRSEQQHLEIETRKALSADLTKIEINSITVSAYVEQSKIPEELLRMALSYGFTLATEDDIPPEKTSDEDYVSGIVRIAQKGTNNIGGLDSNLRSKKKAIGSFFDALLQKEEGPWVVTKPFVLMLACCLVFRDGISVSMLSRDGWSKVIAERVVVTAKGQSL